MNINQPMESTSAKNYMFLTTFFLGCTICIICIIKIINYYFLYNFRCKIRAKIFPLISLFPSLLSFTRHHTRAACSVHNLLVLSYYFPLTADFIHTKPKKTQETIITQQFGPQSPSFHSLGYRLRENAKENAKGIRSTVSNSSSIKRSTVSIITQQFLVLLALNKTQDFIPIS